MLNFFRKKTVARPRNEAQQIAKSSLRRAHNCLLRCLSRWDTEHARKYAEEALSVVSDAIRYVKDEPEISRLSDKLTDTDKSILWNRIVDWVEAENAWTKAQRNLEPNTVEYDRIRRHQIRCNATVQRVIGLLDSPADITQGK